MSNPFKDIFSKMIGGSGDNENNAVGIDIGSSAIKIVEIRKKGGRVILETYGAIALGPYADLEAGQVTNLSVEKSAEALIEVLKQSGSSPSKPAFAIPVQLSLIFTIELPAQIDENQIGEIVPTEARKYIPLPITEVSLDYFIFPKKELSFEEMNKRVTDENNPDVGLSATAPQQEKTNVLVVATQNDAVARYRSIISESKLDASFFEIETFSSIRSNFEHELSPVLLMDFGASRTKLSIVEFGMLKSFHSIDRGGADISTSIAQALSIPFGEAERMKKELGLFGNEVNKNIASIIEVHTNYIFHEANSVLLDYERKHNRIISKVIFTGGGSLLKGLLEVATNNFRAEVSIGHPFNKVGAPSFLSKVLDAVGPEFSVALGLALRKLQ